MRDAGDSESPSCGETVGSGTDPAAGATGKGKRKTIAERPAMALASFQLRPTLVTTCLYQPTESLRARSS